MFSFLRSVICLMLLTSACLAQTRKPDIIVKRDNTKIESLVKEIDETTIRYQKVSNPTGPVYTIKKKEDVVTILYANGEVENFTGHVEAEKPVSTTQSPMGGLTRTNQLRFQKGDGFYFNEGNIPRKEMPSLLKEHPVALKHYKKGHRWARPFIAIPVGIILAAVLYPKTVTRDRTTYPEGGSPGLVVLGVGAAGVGFIVGTVNLFSKAKNFRAATYEYNKATGVGVSSYHSTVTFGISASGNAGFVYTF